MKRHCILFSALSSVVLAPCSAAPASTPGPATSLRTADRGRLLKVFDQWIKTYRRGKTDIRSRQPVPKSSPVLRSGEVLAPNGPVTPQRELELLLDAAARDGSADSVLRVLVVAGTGLDRYRYTYAHAPATVRSLGERALRRFRGAEARDAIAKVAEGELTPRSRAYHDAARAAALRALGAIDEPAFRPVLEQGLEADESFLRLAAADGLAAMCAADSAEALTRALQREIDEAALIGIVGAMRRVFERHQARLAAPVQRLGVDTAIKALGRTSWRADLTLVDFLATFRATATVPRLIDLLAEYDEHPQWFKTGKVSVLLRNRVHETLQSLSGAFFPYDRPDQWREFWAAEKDRFKLAKAKPPEEKRGTTAGFFGIPVEGRRIVFIIDVSGSMRQPYPRGTSAGPRGAGGPTKLDVAKEQLIEAVEALPAETRFNVVLFSQQVRTWQDKLVLASEKNKARLKRFVDSQRPQTSTNLWGGMQQALKMKSLVYGDRYDSNVDEIFLLSDGAPTFGDIIDTDEILRTVNETNRFSQVKINTVYIDAGFGGRGRPGGGRRGPRGGRPGGGPPGGFPGGGFGRGMGAERLMEEMAKANGGKFVRPR